ncbi:MAG: hypothetical protein BWY30_01011 [Tenericutes bacterium ADurb.Bin239]|jgi:predicted RNA-binding protein YlqC (UPF0109 family)|nr:MAG: hypothetical protein BWY30_01011 [Tenericutes bacterium ADurb.Bin239]
MRDYEALVRTIITPLVKNEKALLIRQTNEGQRIIINIFAESDDIAVLIGRRGVIANALREVVSVAGKLDEEHVFLRFEALDENK